LNINAVPLTPDVASFNFEKSCVTLPRHVAYFISLKIYAVPLPRDVAFFRFSSACCVPLPRHVAYFIFET